MIFNHKLVEWHNSLPNYLKNLLNSPPRLIKALDLFTKMRTLIRSSDRTPNIIGALYEAIITNLEGPSPSTTIYMPSINNNINISI